MPTGKVVIEVIFRAPSMMNYAPFVKRLEKRPDPVAKRKRKATARELSRSKHAVLGRLTGPNEPACDTGYSEATGLLEPVALLR
jgi:hypothetical protein